jgi:hypothetical protein
MPSKLADSKTPTKKNRELALAELKTRKNPEEKRQGDAGPWIITRINSSPR